MIRYSLENHSFVKGFQNCIEKLSIWKNIRLNVATENKILMLETLGGMPWLCQPIQARTAASRKKRANTSRNQQEIFDPAR
jgi:hypothetical protein